MCDLPPKDQPRKEGGHIHEGRKMGALSAHLSYLVEALIKGGVTSPVYLGRQFAIFPHGDPGRIARGLKTFRLSVGTA